MADDAIEIHPGTPNVYFEQKLAKGDETRQPIMDDAAYVVEDDSTCSGSRTCTIEPDVRLRLLRRRGPA